MQPITLTLLTASEPDAAGLRRYTYRVEIPSESFLYSVSAQSEAEAVSKIRRDTLIAMRGRPFTSRSTSLAVGNEVSSVTGGLVLGIVAATLAARWAINKVYSLYVRGQGGE